MTLKLIAGPTEEPLSVAEAKSWCRVPTADTSEDSAFEDLITGAREEVEHHIGRALITQTWDRILDGFIDENGAPIVEIELGFPGYYKATPQIQYVKYLDIDGVDTTLDSSHYVVRDAVPPGWLLPVYGESWPDALVAADSVRIRFTAGTALAEDVSRAVKNAIRRMVEAQYTGAELPSWHWRTLDRFINYTA